MDNFYSGRLFPTLQHHPGTAPQQDGSQHELPDHRYHRLSHRRHLPRHLHRVSCGLCCQIQGTEKEGEIHEAL